MDQVQCPNCKAVIKLSDRIYGKKFRCKCGIKIQMPDAPLDALKLDPSATPSQSSESATPTRSADLTNPSNTSDQEITFTCPGCFMTLKVPAQLAGYVSRCTCGIKVRIPGQ